MSDVTSLLEAINQGDVQATRDLLPLVYDELRRLAASKLAHERPGQTLDATALVHEAYLRLVDQQRVSWQGRAHFFGLAAQAMRRILVDHARRRKAAKRGYQHAVTLDDDTPVGAAEPPPDEILAVDEALERLAALDPRQARLVELRYFAGFTIEEAAELLGVSPATAKRDWAMARAWLQRELGSQP
jgi:RNA polymerase sigma factor (TIGR02999 family)